MVKRDIGIEAVISKAGLSGCLIVPSSCHHPQGFPVSHSSPHQNRCKPEPTQVGVCSLSTIRVELSLGSTYHEEGQPKSKEAFRALKSENALRKFTLYHARQVGA
jgi:hypothetical protein